ncbi:MAG: nuclear transport factor 2 family protein [Terriglobales bacterium]
MRRRIICVFIVSLACLGVAQQPPEKMVAEAATPRDGSSDPSSRTKLKEMFESKVRAEWDALKKKDAKAYGELLADDYEGVEVDGQGERTKSQAISEVASGNVFDYTLWGFKLVSSTPDTAFVVFEITMQFPPRSVVRYSRVYIGELWVKRNGEWKDLHYQETHVK